MSTPIRYSHRPLPAVYYSAMELHLIAVRRLGDFRVPRGQSSPLLRAMRNSCTALFLASHGARPAAHLRRAKDGMLSCLSLILILRGEGHVDDEFYRETSARIDHILAGIDQLDPAQVDSWANAPVPTPSADAKEQETDSPFKRVAAMIERIGKILQSTPLPSNALKPVAAILGKRRRHRASGKGGDAVV